MNVGDKVRVNTPDEKWCHGRKGIVAEACDGDNRWVVKLEGLPPNQGAHNPYAFHTTELTIDKEGT